jgi:hypothetical protein
VPFNHPPDDIQYKQRMEVNLMKLFYAPEFGSLADHIALIEARP